MTMPKSFDGLEVSRDYINQIRQHIDAAEAAMKAVHDHCMAHRVTLDKDYLIVIFPDGYQLDGVRVTRQNGVKWAAEQALRKMEQVWTESYPAGRAPL